MKGFYTVLAGILFLCMVLLPVLAISEEKLPPKSNSSTVEKQTKTSADSSKFKVKFTDSGEIKEIDQTEYIIGVVAAEMPANYEEEALKAQAVAAFTYAFKKKNDTTEKYDVTDSESFDQRYITKSERKEKWKDDFENYEKKVEKAVKSVSGQIIRYKNKPILAVYHSISSGKTEDAKTVWGSDYPYLKSVESVGDLLSDEYLSTVEFTVSDFTNILESLGAKPSGDASGFLGKSSKTSGGMVKTIKICGKSFKGTEIRKAFSLRSACFDIEYENSKFKFTVRGYGHMLGLSQNGANYMAKQGSDYKEILLWYYSGCKLGAIKV